MKLYKINKNSNHRKAERDIVPAGVSGLKIAAGGEDLIILSEEAIKRFKKESSAKNREQELVKLALQHINDHNPEFDDPGNDPEFRRAEKLFLLAELAVRIACPVKSRNIYEKVTDFVVEQMKEQNHGN